MSSSGSTALAGTFGYINGGGTAAGTVSETDQFTYASITTETLSVSASNSWSSYESRTFGNGSYSFSSVLYQQSTSLSFTDDVAARQTLTGSGAMTAALSGPGRAVVAYNGSLATAVNSVSYSSFDSYSFSSYESYTSLVHIGGTSSL